MTDRCYLDWLDDVTPRDVAIGVAGFLSGWQVRLDSQHEARMRAERDASVVRLQAEPERGSRTGRGL